MNDIFNKALLKFGETKNYLECGFILPDGKMLKLKRSNGTHNDQLQELVGTTLEKFLNLGAIRTLNDRNNCNIEMHLKPTVQQIAMLQAFLDNYNPQTSYFSCDLIDKNRSFNQVIDLETYSPSKVINFITMFYSGKTPHISESIVISEKNDKPSFIKQKFISGFMGLVDLFRSNKIKIGSLQSSPNVTDITKAGYDRFLNDIMDDYVRWEKIRKDLTWGERVLETRKSPRVDTYKNIIFTQGSKLKLEDVFKFKHDDWLVFVANYYKTTNGGIMIAMVVIEPAKQVIAKLKQMNYNIDENTINLSDVIKNNNIPKEIQTIIERNAKYYIYCNKAAEKWVIERQGTGFRQYVTYLTLQSYGKIDRTFETVMSPDKIFDNIKHTLGITKNYKLAGMILPDGTLIKYTLLTDEIISKIFNTEDVTEEEAWAKLATLGIIKIACEFTFNVLTYKVPTYIQFQVLSQILNNYKDGQGTLNAKNNGEENIRNYTNTIPFDVIQDIKTIYSDSNNMNIETYLNTILQLLK